MGYKIIILDPAVEFIHSLNIKLRAKTYRTIELLKVFGPFIKEPYSKKISGKKSLFELRVKFASDICRLFYFHYEGKIFIITSGYIKKEQKTSKIEIEKAIKIMQLYEESHD